VCRYPTHYRRARAQVQVCFLISSVYSRHQARSAFTVPELQAPGRQGASREPQGPALLQSDGHDTAICLDPFMPDCSPATSWACLRERAIRRSRPPSPVRPTCQGLSQRHAIARASAGDALSRDITARPLLTTSPRASNNPPSTHHASHHASHHARTDSLVELRQWRSSCCQSQCAP